MHFVEKPGTSLEAMTAITVRASKDLRAIPGVRNFGSHIGRAEVADEVVGPNFTELWISIDPDVDYTATLKKIEEVVDGYPGLYRDVLTYLQERIKEVLTGAERDASWCGCSAPTWTCCGPRRRRSRRRWRRSPGVTNLKVEPQVLRAADRGPAAARGGRAVRPDRRATSAGRRRRCSRARRSARSTRSRRCSTWSSGACRRAATDVAALRALPIDTPAGVQVRLGDVADVLIVPTPNEIKRENASRRLDITCNVQGRDLGSVAARDRGEGAGRCRSTASTTPSSSASTPPARSRRRRLYALAGLALLGHRAAASTSTSRSWRLTLLVALDAPVRPDRRRGRRCCSTGGVLSLGSLVGFVTVLGIAARNGIMLVSHYRHLEDEEGDAVRPRSWCCAGRRSGWPRS